MAPHHFYSGAVQAGAGEAPLGPLAVEQAASGTAASGTQAVVTISSPTDGNFLVLAANAIDGASITGISQTNVTWHKACEKAGNTHHVEIWYAQNVQSAGTAVTATWNSSSGNKTAIVGEYSGMPRVDWDTQDLLDQVAAGASDNWTTFWSGNTSTTTTAKSLWIGALGSGIVNITGTSYGYTHRQTAYGPSTLRCHLLDLFASSIGNARTAGTLSALSKYCCQAAAFKGEID